VEVVGTAARSTGEIGALGNLAAKAGDEAGDRCEFAGLGARRLGNVGDHRTDAADLLDNVADRLLGAPDDIDAAVDLRLGGGHQRLDLARGLGRTLGKRANFLGDDGKSATAVAGARRLDAGIERQQIGLEGNLVDRADDLADLLGRGFDVGHGGDRLTGDRAARFDRLLRDRDLFFRRPRPRRAVANPSGHGFERRGRFAEADGLILGPGSIFVRRGRNGLRSRPGDRDPLLGGEKCRLHLVDRAVERVGQLGMVCGHVARNANREVARGQRTEDRAEYLFDLQPVALALGGEVATVLHPQFVEAQGYGDLHIDHHQPDDRADEVDDLALPLAVAGQEATAGEIGDHRLQEVFHDHGVAGDMPARIEPHAAFGIGEDLDAFGIERIETGVRQHIPMGGKQVVQPVELPLAGKVAGGIGEGLQPLEDVAKTGLEVRLEHMAILAQQITIGVAKAGKAQPLAQASRLCACRPFCRRKLPHCQSPHATASSRKAARIQLSWSIDGIADLEPVMSELAPVRTHRRLFLEPLQ